MYTCRRLVLAVTKVPLGGAVISVKTEKDLNEKMNVSPSLKFFPNVSAVAVSVGVR